MFCCLEPVSCRLAVATNCRLELQPVVTNIPKCDTFNVLRGVDFGLSLTVPAVSWVITILVWEWLVPVVREGGPVAVIGRGTVHRSEIMARKDKSVIEWLHQKWVSSDFKIPLIHIERTRGVRVVQFAATIYDSRNLHIEKSQRAHDVKWRRTHVAATWFRRINVDTTSFWHQMPTGN